MFRGRSGRRGRTGGPVVRRAGVRNMIAGADSLPSVIKTVAAQPPDVNLDPTRYVVIVGELKKNASAENATYSLSDLYGDMNIQLGANLKRRAQIQHVKVWGSPTTGFIGSLVLEDIRSGVASKASGTLTLRPATGIDYPPHLRIELKNGASGDWLTINNEIGGVIHTLVRVWGQV